MLSLTSQLSQHLVCLQCPLRFLYLCHFISCWHLKPQTLKRFSTGTVSGDVFFLWHFFLPSMFGPEGLHEHFWYLWFVSLHRTQKNLSHLCEAFSTMRQMLYNQQRKKTHSEEFRSFYLGTDYTSEFPGWPSVWSLGKLLSTSDNTNNLKKLPGAQSPGVL